MEVIRSNQTDNAMGATSNLFGNPVYLSDGGLETTLIYHQGINLNHFAAFELLTNEAGRNELRKYYEPYLRLASQRGTRFILQTPTWRASPEWAAKLGYSNDEVVRLNREAVRFVRSIAGDVATNVSGILISGAIGPRGDGYKVEHIMTREEAKTYHEIQVNAFASEGVDLVEAMTMNYSDEAIGIVKAAESASVPVVISFTVETDGKVPSGESLKQAIERTDQMTSGYVEYFMINCAHPQHFIDVLKEDGNWKRRIQGIRANASMKSHAELDESTELDAGDKEVLAQGYSRIREFLPDLRVIGGCCGTDHTHVACISDALLEKGVA